MSIRKYTSVVRQTPPTERMLGRPEQRPNAAGGMGWTLDMWRQLDRFLILGTTSTYYASERALTVQAAGNVLACIKADGVRVVNRVVEFAKAGRAPRMQPLLFVLALCMKHPNADRTTREAANAALTSVCNIGTHVFDLANAVQAIGGWGAGTRRAFARWYMEKPLGKLALQLVKYQSRNGFSHRDVLRLAHPHTDGTRDAMFAYAADRLHPVDLNKHEWTRDVHGAKHIDGKSPTCNVTIDDPMFRIIEGAERAKSATSARGIVKLIQDYELPRECIPTAFLNDASVWDALLVNMPITATIRNLGKMTAIGLLKPNSAQVRTVVDRLTDMDVIRRGKVHPVAYLQALATYRQGHGELGKLTWTPVAPVVDALDAGYYQAFGALEPTSKRYALGIDVSGSMTGGSVCGMAGVTPNMAAAAMAMVTARLERDYMIGGFGPVFVDLGITAHDRLDVAMRKAQQDFGSTNVAALVEYCLKHRIEVDCFCVYTDNETWHGARHPVEALRDYRQRMGIPARVVYCAMTATDFTVADPTDGGMLDLVGFSSDTPAVIGAFAKGEI